MDSLEPEDIADIDLDDDDIREKVEDFQAIATIKAAIVSAVVLVLQACFLTVVAVVAMVSSDTGHTFNAVPLPEKPNQPREFHLRIPAAADTYVNQAVPRSNYGDKNTLLLGRENDRVCNPLIGFALPDLSSHTIKTVDLVITPQNAWDSTAPALKILTCKSTWKEQAVTWNDRPETGSLLGFLPKGQGFDGQKLRIPLDRHAFSTNRFNGIWLQTSAPETMREFAAREAGEKGPVLIIEIEGLTPPPKTQASPVTSAPDSGTPEPSSGGNDTPVR